MTGVQTCALPICKDYDFHISNNHTWIIYVDLADVSENKVKKKGSLGSECKYARLSLYISGGALLQY